MKALLARIFTRTSPPADLPGRSSSGQYTVSPKTRRAMNRKASINCELGVYVALSTNEQRLAETEAYFARVRETEEDRFRRLAPRLFAGLGGKTEGAR